MKLIAFCFAIQIVIFSADSSERCALRDYGKSRRVCVCNQTYCDTIGPVIKSDVGTFLVYTSNEDGLRLEMETGKFTNITDSTNKISIDSSQVFQDIYGFGGAITDATCLNILSLNKEVQNKLMQSYFSEIGIEYNIGRIPMAATDFSTHPYTYQDEEDIELRNFSLAKEDYKLKLPIALWARNMTNDNLLFIVSTWIAPKWMKTNNKYASGFIKTNLYQVWANYFVKFLDAYKEEGIEFWGITTGNEPLTGFIPGIRNPTICWTSVMQKIFIRDNLGPTIRNSSHSDIKILMLDDQRLFLAGFMDEILSDKSNRYDYIDGVALHWYLDNLVPSSQIDIMREAYPEKFFLATEASEGSLSPHPVELGSWDRAEDYAYSIIQDMNSWVTGWMDWNMVLNLQGGPTYTSNFCDAPILVNSTAQEFLKQPMFYALGHFSKFIPRGSQKIFGPSFSKDLPVATFKRPDDGIVVVILNLKHTYVETVLEDNNRGYISLNVTPHSITTIVYW